jgi:hypothetical protein
MKARAVRKYPASISCRSTMSCTCAVSSVFEIGQIDLDRVRHHPGHRRAEFVGAVTGGGDGLLDLVEIKGNDVAVALAQAGGSEADGGSRHGGCSWGVLLFSG